jgi:hypothetical protein
MGPIRFEAADVDVDVVVDADTDADDWTTIGGGLTRLARAADRPLVDHEGAKYALGHDDGYAVGDESLRAGEPFYLDPETGEVLRVVPGSDRRTPRGEDGDGDGDGDGAPERTAQARGTAAGEPGYGNGNGNEAGPR